MTNSFITELMLAPFILLPCFPLALRYIAHAFNSSNALGVLQGPVPAVCPSYVPKTRVWLLV